VQSPNSTLSVANSANPFDNPTVTYRYGDGGGYDDDEEARDQFTYTGADPRNNRPASLAASSINTPYWKYLQEDVTERLRKGGASASIRSAYDNDFLPPVQCPAHKPFYEGAGNWFAITIIILAVYSTVFSGIYFVIALKAPRYGKFIRANGGSLTPASASLVAAIFAKTIELSFVTAFVTFLGQVLSRRAFMKQSKGVTLAEFSMRGWIMQPGTMITHWESVRYAGLTVLGALSLTAAIVAMLYTSASDALVQPQLTWGGLQNMVIGGLVKTDFHNPIYIANQCASPIQNDPQEKGTTCLQIEHASQGYHNYQRYITFWDTLQDAMNGSIRIKERPQGFGLLYENTTVTASWVEAADVAEVSAKFGGRIVNNASLAMPHAGVPAAARDPINDIYQPDDLQGVSNDAFGVYSIQASVPAPAINVLCVNIDRSELAPIVYSEFPGSPDMDMIEWPKQASWPGSDQWRNETVVDDIFEWGPKYGSQRPPLFATYPIDFNTILNDTGESGRSSIYLLGKGGPNEPEGYFMCSLKAYLTPNCSTQYNATASGATLEAMCEDPGDDFRYIKSNPGALSGNATVNYDWPNIGSEWAKSMSLSAGIVEGNASNARLLTQLMLGAPELNPSLPSPAEALAVMGGCTLLMGTMDAPFVETWNYTQETAPNATLLAPVHQFFNAQIQNQEYASGGTSTAQKAFLAVLIFVFVVNFLILVYFILNRGLVTDFSEPPNFFSLALNSPPSRLLAGSCGGGPEGEQFRVPWLVGNEGEHLFMKTPHEGNPDAVSPTKGPGGNPEDRYSLASTVFELGSVTSPINRMYSKLSKRKSML